MQTLCAGPLPGGFAQPGRNARPFNRYYQAGTALPGTASSAPCVRTQLPLGSIKSRRRSKRIPALRLGIERVLMSPDPRVTNPAPASPPGGITDHGRIYYSEVVYTIICELSLVYWIIRMDYVYLGAGRDFFTLQGVPTGRKGG